MKFILGQKIGMSQVFDEKGRLIPVTLVEAGPCIVTQIKNEEKDSYNAIQIGYLKKTKNLKRSEKGKEYKHLREFRDKSDMKVGDEIKVSVFLPGEKIKVSGVSKGKGFAGAVKRHGFKGKLSATHGTKHEHRTIGSVGSRFPQHVIKGKRMPGRMGSERVTVKNLKVIKVDPDNNLIALEGAIPGRRGTILELLM